MPQAGRICRLVATAAAGAAVGALYALAGCQADAPKPAFEAATPQARAAAVAEAATGRDPEAIPDLIEALDDSDPVVRSWAIRGLEEMTGQTLGYEPFAPQGRRDEAIERWVRWRRAGGQADSVDEAQAPDADNQPR